MKKSIIKTVRTKMLEQVENRYGKGHYLTVCFESLIKDETIAQKYVAEIYESLMDQGLTKPTPSAIINIETKKGNDLK